MGVCAKLQQQWVDNHAATNTEQACVYQIDIINEAKLTPCICSHILK